MGDLSRCDPDSLAACAIASALLKACGFDLVYTSMLSEACYYGKADHPGVIRVACHRFGRSETRTLTMPVLSCLTFGSHQGLVTEGQVRHRTALVIGQYVMARAEARARDAAAHKERER